MSIATQLNDLENNIKTAYTAAQLKGATLPQLKNMVNLAQTINSIEGGSGSESETFSDQLFLESIIYSTPLENESTEVSEAIEILQNTIGINNV